MAYTIPAARTYDWATYCGIPGGIPTRTTIYSTLTSSATSAQINAAIAACPSGQVVYLSAGTYTNSQITFALKSGVTLRGAGAGQTILQSSGSSHAITNSNYVYVEASGISLLPIASGGTHTKGSLVVTLASAPSAYFVAGNIMAVAQDNSPNTFDTGIGVYQRVGGTGSVYNISATRSLRFLSRIVSVTGNAITIATPLPWSFTDSLTPKAYAQNGNGATSLCGVEDLTIDCNSTSDRAVDWENADRCWVKGVEIKNCGGTSGQIFMANCVQNEVRRCYIHDVPGYPTQSDGYGVMLHYGSCNCLVEDSVFDRTSMCVLMNGAAGNAVIYNYGPRLGRASTTYVTDGVICNHGSHGIMNLFEGNIIPKFQNDGYHGSTSHQTLFRNSISGYDEDGKTWERRLVNLCRASYYHNVVGNIIGHSSYNPKYYEMDATASHASTDGSVYALGWPNGGNVSLTPAFEFDGYTGTYPDADVESTLIRHGNYDYYTDSQYEWADADHDIADSLFYDSKPDYFGALTWPPIDPVTPTANPNPAKNRWDTYVVSADLDDLFTSNTYWVSPTGAATWANARSETALSGAACTTPGIADSNAVAGDTIYFRGGTYTIGSTGIAACLEPVNSGAENNPIQYLAYSDEEPLFVQAGLTYKCYGMLLNGDSYIKVSGLRFHNFQQYGCWIYGGGSYNEITNCRFTRDAAYTAGDRVIVIGGVASPWSTHNWIHGNYIQGHHHATPCNEAIDLIKVGGAQSSPEYSADNYNTIEDNYLCYSGHANIVTYSKYNVIRNNISHNEPWLSGCTLYQYGTSVTSLAIGTGTKTLTTQAALSFTTGYPVSVISQANSANAMYGTITSYNSTSGELVLNITNTGGSGTLASWYISKVNAPVYTDTGYNGLYGHRVSCFGDSDISHDNWNLVEGNRFGFAGVNPNNGGPSCLDIESPRNIVRYNYVYGGMASGMYFKSASGTAQSGGVNNRVYNNTVYHCGYGWDETLYGALNVTYNGNGIAQHSNDGGDTNNVIKNNIVYDNANGDICWLGTATPPQTPWTGDTVENNLTGVDPLFVDPTLTTTNSQNLFADLDGYAATPLPDLSVSSGSDAIGTGVHLTLANGGGTASVTLVVDDADYFQDGTRGSSLSTIAADWIAVGTTTNVIEIESIDYDTKTITLATATTWADNAYVWLYKKSDGAITLLGDNPDIGAFESYDENPGFTQSFKASIVVSESDVARLYVEYPHKRVVTGTAATYDIHVEPYGDFTASVTLDATGLPTNATDSYGTNPIAYTGTTTATIATTGVAAGTYSIYFTGTASGGEVGSVRVILEVVATDDCAPKVPVRRIRVKQGESAVFTIEANPTAGYTGNMDLTASGVPTGASGAFADATIAYNESTTYTVSAGTAAVGTHEITITGEGPA